VLPVLIHHVHVERIYLNLTPDNSSVLYLKNIWLLALNIQRPHTTPYTCNRPSKKRKKNKETKN